MGDNAYVNASNFLWDGVNNYVVDKKLSGINGPQVSAQGLANAVDIFQPFFYNDIVQKIVTETCRNAEQFKNSRGIIFSKWLRGSEWQSLTAEEIYVVLAFFMLMSTVQKPSVTFYFS